MAAGWANHDKCLLCLHNIVESEVSAGSSHGNAASTAVATSVDSTVGGFWPPAGDDAVHDTAVATSASSSTDVRGGGVPDTGFSTTGPAPDALSWKDVEAAKPSLQRTSVVATQAQIDKAPIGNLHHRGWACQAEPLAAARRKWAPEKDVATVTACDVQGNPAWERALFPKPPRPLRRRAAVESFRWITEPEGGIISGTVYPDGSALDGPAVELMRCGWSFVVRTAGVVTAAACGVPPPWITDIAGSEAWALLQAAIRALPGGCVFKGDCKSCIDMVKSGLASATSAKRVLARVYALLIPALEDVDHDNILWMPAHKTKEDVGRVALSNGAMLT